MYILVEAREIRAISENLGENLKGGKLLSNNKSLSGVSEVLNCISCYSWDNLVNKTDLSSFSSKNMEVEGDEDDSCPHVDEKFHRPLEKDPIDRPSLMDDLLHKDESKDLSSKTMESQALESSLESMDDLFLKISQAHKSASYLSDSERRKRAEQLILQVANFIGLDEEENGSEGT